MPYITQAARTRLKKTNRSRSIGELNYLISTLLAKYLIQEGTSYGTINDIMGVLACVKDEFYQRVAIPYEATKRQENGDVY